MSCLGRIAVRGLPHHVTQRGNRRKSAFFQDGDFDLYRDILAERCRRRALELGNGQGVTVIPDEIYMERVRWLCGYSTYRYGILRSQSEPLPLSLR
jgi:REP element-mobilizing transposase RayT